MKKMRFRMTKKRQDMLVVGACSASAVASVMLRAPDLMALPLYAVAQNRERIAERLKKVEKVGERDIRCFFNAVDDALKRGEGKLKKVM